jgi:hypothetical protein
MTSQFSVVVAEDDLKITDWMESLLSMCPFFVAHTIKSTGQLASYNPNSCCENDRAYFFALFYLFIRFLLPQKYLLNPVISTT